jgi:hypothetical protein
MLAVAVLAHRQIAILLVAEALAVAVMVALPGLVLTELQT